MKVLEVQAGKRALVADVARIGNGPGRVGFAPTTVAYRSAASVANAMYFRVLSRTLLANRLMLAHSTTIRDVSRALPALISDPDLVVPVFAEPLDAHTAGLRLRYDSLRPVIERAGNTLAEAMKKLGPEEIADPKGVGCACPGSKPKPTSSTVANTS